MRCFADRFLLLQTHPACLCSMQESMSKSIFIDLRCRNMQGSMRRGGGGGGGGGGTQALKRWQGVLPTALSSCKYPDFCALGIHACVGDFSCRNKEA